MQSVFEGYLERISVSCDVAGFTDAMAYVTKELGFPFFAYISFSEGDGRSPLLISNYSVRWIKRYTDRNYQQIDPVISEARKRHSPFHWDSSLRDSSSENEEKQLFAEAAEFGIDCGLTVPVHDRRGQFAAVSFAVSAEDRELVRKAEECQLALQMLAVQLHVGVRRRFARELTVNGVRLTPREYECLRWAARGKSAWDIAGILGVKRRTVGFHLDNVRAKLDVRTVTQAVALLVETAGL